MSDLANVSRKRGQHDSNDSDSEEEPFLAQAIPLTKREPELVNGIPVSGEDYLLLVQQQRRQCARTVVAPPLHHVEKVSLPPLYRFSTDADGPPPPPAVLPLPDWQVKFVASFKAMQKTKQEGKAAHDDLKMPATRKEEWFQLLYGSEAPPDNASLALVEQFPQRIILKLLTFHTEWLSNFKDDMLPWIYTLLLYLDPVLTSQDTSILRDVARICIRIRNQKQESDDQVVQLNIIITIISKVFGQADLV